MKRILFIDAGDCAGKMHYKYRPLWAGYLASYVDAHAGEGEFDFRYMKRNLHHLENEIQSYKPDVVAISSVSGYYTYAMQCAGIVKMHGLPVIVGGVHISAMSHTLTEDMDVACIGEGGETFSELLAHLLEHGRFRLDRLEGIRGIVYRKNGMLVQTPLRPGLKTMDEMPHPKRALAGYLKSDTMLTSLGCPFKCIFCSVTRYWSHVMYASADYVREEIAELVGNGVKLIRFYDDLFTANKERLKSIAEMIISNSFNKRARFTCFARASTLTSEVVGILKAMNIVAAYMGLESGCDRTLKYLKGHGSAEESLNAIMRLKQAGIQANASFIIGAPDETLEEIMETYEFIRKSPLDGVSVSPLYALPGTPIWNDAKERGLVSDDMDWRRLHGLTLSNRLSAEELHTLTEKFKRLCFRKRMTSLSNSPRLSELPRTAILELKNWYARRS
jgi:anaerobic magnesium-protoporphyrin IX monomethyl ester cyclase